MSSSRLASRLYSATPVWLQNVAISTLGYRMRRRRYGPHFHAELQSALTRSTATADDIHAYQQAQWERQIRPALAHVPAYSGLSTDIDARHAIPVLRKQALRDDPAAYCNTEWPAAERIQAHTSGTTGAGLQFATTPYADQRQWAYWWRYRMWHGIKLDEWCGVFGGREVVPAGQKTGALWRVNRPNYSLMFSQYHLTTETAVEYLREIERRGIRWLHGYPSILAFLAKAGVEAGLAGSTQVRWITLGAENVLSHQARQIKEMFGVAPLQHYGLAEGVVNISECPEGKLHIDEDFSLVDLEPVAGRPGDFHLIGTTLSNAAMPLLRYDTGDIVRLDSQQEACSCGRPGRVVAEIDGRQEDYLVLSDGVMVGRVDHLFKDATRVIEAQIVQNTAGEATFRIVKADDYSSEDEQALRREAELRFGGRLAIDFDYTTELPRGPTGKLRMVQNNIPTARVGQ